MRRLSRVAAAGRRRRPPAPPRGVGRRQGEGRDRGIFAILLLPMIVVVIRILVIADAADR
jgi:hypothetical protein